MTIERLRRGWLALLAAAVLAGCGGGWGDPGDDDDGDGAQLRLVNATLSQPSLSLAADGNAVVSNVSVDTASGYVAIDADNPTLELRAGTSGTGLASGARGLTDDSDYTLVAYERAGLLRTSLLVEDGAEPADGRASLRVLDLALEAGSVDVYVAPSTVDIGTVASPSFTVMPAEEPGAAVLFNTGTYRVRVTASGDRTDVRLDIPSVTLANRQVATLLLTPTRSGTLTDGGLLVQRGTYAASRNGNARVRLAAAVSGGALVAASAVAASGAASSPISAEIPAPAVSLYALVPAASVLAVTVNGAPLAAPAGTLVAGSDATLAVYGPAASAVATLLVDDNQPPTSSATFKLRLFNGLTGAAMPLSLTANLLPVAASVAPGTASAYGIVTVSPSQRLTVTAGATQVYNEAGLSIAGNGVYTLFLLGDAMAPVALLSADR